MVNSHLTVMDPDDRQGLIARSAVQKKTKKHLPAGTVARRVAFQFSLGSPFFLLNGPVTWCLDPLFLSSSIFPI